MELSEIKDLLPSFDKLRQKVMAENNRAEAIKTFLEQWDPALHESSSTTKRPDKLINVDDGFGKTVAKSVAVTRLGLPIQKQIVGLAAAFLVGNPVKLAATPANELEKDLLAVVKKTWAKNKLDFLSKRIAKIMMSETEVAELWYTEEADPLYWANTPNAGSKFRLRMKIIANSLGDSLYPVFDNAGDMVAFGRGYYIKIDGKNVEHFDLYTEKEIHKGVLEGSSWVVATETNIIGKIPVIYYSQPAPEWKDVQSLIDRFEKTLSNHSDTNDYFGSPMVKVKGTIKGFASKGESGKVIEVENGGDAEYMSWDQSPKSQELEFKNLRSLIYDQTSTPDISFEQMKSLGTYSGLALKMLFLSAHMKAADKEETFGVCVQRRINFIISAMSKINVKLEKATGLEITPVFEYFLPKDEAGVVDMLVAATGSKAIMTTESAVRQNPLVQDPDQEIEKLKEETTPLDITPI